MNLNLINPVWKFSAKWLLKKLNCNIDICHGKCCTGAIFWPSKTSKRPDFLCEHLGDNGCNLLMSQRPITCLLYPLIVRNGTVVLHFRCNSYCKKNYGQGESIIDSLKSCFITLFGDEEYKKLKCSVDKGIDYFMDIENIVVRYQEEKKLELNNLPPKVD
jgi:hypothetical protein